MPGPPVDTCSNSTPGRQLAQDGFEWNPCGKARKARVRTAIPTLTTGHGGLDLALAGGAGRVASRVGRLKSHTGTSYARPAKVSVTHNRNRGGERDVQASCVSRVSDSSSGSLKIRGSCSTV